MRVLVLYAHPVETSFQNALHRAVVEALRSAGHEVDDCDLYAEGFNPLLTRQERLDYHDTNINRRPVDDYVRRLKAAEALVLVFPVWNFGYPAILKGFFDRVFLPGVSFDLKEDGGVTGLLTHIRKVVAVATYGGTRLRAILAGDPPRKAVTRVLWGQTSLSTSVAYHACYDMNRSTQACREEFLARAAKAMARL
jgi:putative NADPH-quinone reductase